MAKVGIGLVGTGKHGLRYARHIREDFGDRAELVAISRRNAEVLERQAADFGCEGYRDYRDLVRSPRVHAVVAVVPPTVVPEICAAAAEARKPLLLEKPAAPSVAAGREMAERVRRAGIPVMVAHTLRYNSVVRALREALPEIGTLHALRLSQRFEPSPLDWIDDPRRAGGGMILHTGVHSFDLLWWFTGLEVERVSCEMERVVTRATEDNFSATLRLRSGVLASVAGSRATKSRTGPIEIVGSAGLLQGDHVHGTASIVRGTELRPLPVEPPVPTVREVLRDFLGVVGEGKRVPIPLEDGLRAVAVAEACYLAFRAGETVPVPPIV
ncbi:MAG: inositol 2-dehydrogenase [Candidatus Binatia bacterium]|nr:MAG: inositol 2-dehydrogenase [Candidatus Binatia bacterium]